MECVGVLGSLEASMNSVSFFVPSFEHGHENDYKLMIKHIKHNETTHNPEETDPSFLKIFKEELCFHSFGSHASVPVSDKLPPRHWVALGSC